MFTALPVLDELIKPLPEGWVVEFFGDWDVIEVLLHRAAVALSAFGRVYVVFTQDFGGLNPYLMGRLSKVLRSDLSNVFIARAFKVEDTLALLKEAAEEGVKEVLIADPYLHLPNDPRKYWLGTAVTAGIRELVRSGAEVAVFNRVSRFGRFLPEGGNYHHHSIHVLVRLSRGSVSVRADLIKHPLKPHVIKYFRFADLYRGSGASGRTLLDWVGKGGA